MWFVIKVRQSSKVYIIHIFLLFILLSVLPDDKSNPCSIRDEASLYISLVYCPNGPYAFSIDAVIEI